MDERLKKALEFSKFQKTLAVEKQNLKNKLKSSLILNYQNNIFEITLDLLNALKLFKKDKYIILQDTNDIPVKIENIKEFQLEALQKYKIAQDNYFEDYNKLKKLRNTVKIVDISEQSESKSDDSE